jgi:DNA-binding transcriptional MerR regulator
MGNEQFDLTTGELARIAGVSPDTIRLYETLNLIESRRLSNGIRTFRRSTAELVLRLREQRLANRGRRGA